jgi:hypothetical protein
MKVLIIVLYIVTIPKYSQALFSNHLKQNEFVAELLNQKYTAKFESKFCVSAKKKFYAAGQ